MNIYLILDAISIPTIFLIGYYVFLKDSKRLVNKLFFFATLAGTIWAISTFILRIIGFNPALPFEMSLGALEESKTLMGIIANDIGWIGIGFLPSIFLHLTLVITNQKKFLGKKYLAVIYLISFLFFFSFILKEPFTPTYLYALFTVFFILCIGTSSLLLIKDYFSLKSPQEKSRLKYFTIGTLIPGIGGGLLDILMPIIRYGKYAGTTFSLYSFAIGYIFIAQGVLRYGLFINYRDILEIIFRRLTELVIVTDKSGLMLITNEITLSNFGYGKEEIIGKKMENVLKDGKTKWEEISGKLKESGSIIEERVFFVTKNGEELPYLLIFSLTREGIIFIGQDIRGIIDYQQQLEQEVNKKTKELEEIKAVLEIKVAAREKELRELTQILEQRVKEKKKELEIKLKELERFHRLTIGRELKMSEIRGGIDELKRKIGE